MPCLSWLSKWNKRAVKPVQAKNLKKPDQANDKPVPRRKTIAGTNTKPLKAKISMTQTY